MKLVKIILLMIVAFPIAVGLTTVYVIIEFVLRILRFIVGIFSSQMEVDVLHFDVFLLKYIQKYFEWILEEAFTCIDPERAQRMRDLIDKMKNK